MFRKLLLPALVAGMALAPGIAEAQSAPATAPALQQMLVVCRHAKTGETGNSQMNGEAMMCKAVDMQVFMTGPDMSNAKTPDDASRAWKAFLQRTVTTPL